MFFHLCLCYSPAMKVKIVTKDDTIPLPRYETDGAAGVDLAAAEDGALAPQERKLVPTGLFMEIPDGYEGQVRPRSGLAIKHGITMLNNPGTVDSDYRGEVCVILYNSSSEPFEYKKGDRIAQMVFAPVTKAEIIKTEVLSTTARGKSGFGSTGKQ